MKLNTFLPKSLNPFYQKELGDFRKQMQHRNFQGAWQHLERAHVLGQSYPLAHTRVHWMMLRFGFKLKNTKEIFGQIPRLLFGGVKSFVGVIPVGNTGGANIPPLQTLPIAPDLLELFNQAGIKPNTTKS